MSDRLRSLSNDYGQSPWVDNLKRAYLRDGTLAGLVERGVCGVTSNPTIFQKAFAGSTEYDTQITSLVQSDPSTESMFWTIAYDDVSNACDVLAPVYDATKGVDGYVSLEVSPALALDGPGTTAAAREIHEAVAKPNLMVKIPATAPCLESIEAMIGEGRNINVTLIFSLDRYDKVIDAYINGLESLAAAGTTDLSTVASVASFFISRVDSEADKRLDAIGTPEALALKGKAAVTQGVLAYQLFLRRFSGPRWARLAALGARVQRPLWASTSTKNPSYPDTLYVDSLIGPDTVNTLPEPTLEAFADHGTLARTIDTVDAIAAADATWKALASIGVDMDDVAQRIEDEGVASFLKSYDDLIATLATSAATLKSAAMSAAKN
jgi:transaldolase